MPWAQFEIRKVTSKYCTWDLRDSKGRAIATSAQMFLNVEAAKTGIKEFQKISNIKRIVDLDSPKEVNKRGGGKNSIKEKPVIKK